MGADERPTARPLRSNHSKADLMLKPEAAGDRTVKGGPLVVHRAMRGAVMGMEGMKDNGCLDVYDGWSGFLVAPNSLPL